jgi:hypothetical protein
VLLPLLPVLFSTFLFFVYFWGVMVVIFFIAKFFVARADLVFSNYGWATDSAGGFTGKDWFSTTAL